MAKNPYPIPEIPALYALHYLFRIYKNLNDPDSVFDADYNQELSDALYREKIITKKGHDSFVLGFRSRPIEADMNKATGIEVKKLDLISEIIIRHFKLLSKSNLPDNTPLTWETFSRSIISAPAYFETINARRYFKYLSTEEKRLVENYVTRRLNELELIKDSKIINYCTYVWGGDTKSVRCSLLSVDHDKKMALYSHFDLVDGTPVRRAMLRSVRYSYDNNLLSIDMVEEDPKKPNIRASFFLNVLEDQISTGNHMQGVFCANAYGGTALACGKVVLQPFIKFQDALNTATQPGMRSSLLSLEVLDQRVDVKEHLSDLRNLNRYDLSKRLEIFEGFYFMAFITQPNSKRGNNMLSTCMCHIKSNGLVDVVINGELSKIYNAYIDYDVARDSTFLKIKYLVKKAEDSFDVDYKLEVLRDNENQSIHLGFTGVWSGFLDALYGDNMVMIKVDRNKNIVDDKIKDVVLVGTLEIERKKYNDIQEAVKDFPLRAESIINDTHFYPIEQTCKNFLDNPRYQYTMKNKNSNENLSDANKKSDKQVE